MKIDTIELYRVRMPLVSPFRTAFGDTDVIESVLVRMQSGKQYGWGETSPWALPAYSPEWAGSVFLTLLRVLAPLVLGQSLDSGTALQQRLSVVKGNPFAKAGLDLAWWDLHARMLDQPLWRVLGGRSSEVIVGADFGVMESIDLLLKEIARALNQGYRRVKLKFRPGWDLDMVKAVREAFPHAVFHVDCNSAYTLNDAPLLMKLDQFGLAMIEQPLSHDDLLDHAELQRRLATPICLDESISSPHKAVQAIRIGACRWVNLKPGRVGGLTPAIAIHDLCAAAGIPCWVGGMLESSVGSHHCLALATLPNMKYPSDVFPSSRFYENDLADPPMQLSGPSMMSAPETPGAGAEPDPERLRAATVETAVLRAS